MKFYAALGLLMLAVSCHMALAQHVPIVVTDLLGKTYPFEVKLSDTVASLKDKIVDRAHHPFDLQRLVFGGRMLENDRRLSDYGVGPKSVINLVVTTLEGEKPQIFVNFPSGVVASFEFRPTDTVNSLKEKIAIKKGIAQAEQQLSFRDRQLEDGQLLASYGIEDGSTVTLLGAALEPVQQIMVQMPGGAMIVGIKPTTDSVAQLKEKIRAEGGPAVSQQQLIFRGLTLEDTKLVSHYGIQAGSLVEVSVPTPTNGITGNLSGPINVQVKTLSGRLIPVTVDPNNDTVARLKVKVRDAGGPTPPHQQYVLNGVPLDDNRLLSSCGIYEGYVLAITPSRHDRNPALTITVRMIGGRSLELNVMPDEFVSSLKEKISSIDATLPPATEQKLAIGNKVLADDRTLAYYGVNAGSVVDLLAPPVEGQAVQQIFVNSSPGTTFVFDVRPSDTVANLKERIAQLGLDPYVEQQLYMQDKLLGDASKLSECGVRGWSTLNLALVGKNHYVPQVNVRLSSGQTLAILIAPGDTVAGLKAKIALTGAGSNIPLQFNGRQLEDWRSLAEYGVQPGSTLSQVSGPTEAPIMMQIYVQTIGGDRVPLYLASTDTVASLKSKLRDMGMSPRYQLLLYYGHMQLDDSRRLIEYGIQNGSTVTLTLEEYVTPMHAFNPTGGYVAPSAYQEPGVYNAPSGYNPMNHYYAATGFNNPMNGYGQAPNYNHASQGYSSPRY